MIAAWQEIKTGSAPAYRAFQAALADPAQAQRDLLARIITENAGTAFGRAHHFDQIDSYATYAAAVPIRDYDGFASAIAETAGGAEDQLFAGPIAAFERTGGTRSGGKLIPYGAAALEAFAAAVHPMLHDLVTRHPDIAGGRLYASISPATRAPETTAAGLPVGLASDAAYLGPLARPFADLLAVPPEVGAIADIDTWRLETLAHLVEADDLSFVSVWSPSFFTALIDALPRLADRLLPRLTQPAQDRVEHWLGGGPDTGTATLWPRLAVISAWTDASSAGFAKRLEALCPQAVIAPKGVIATEGAITVPLDDGPGAYPALTSSLIEFRAPDTGRCFLAHELQPGAVYDAILTTRGGLYRYDIGDRFRCVAIENGCARLTFEGRAGVVSDMVGEKLDEGFVARALAELGGPARLEACAGPPPYYRLVLDPSTKAPDLAALDRALGANPQYAYARRMNQLGPLVSERDEVAKSDIAEGHDRTGQRLGDAKPVVLVPLPVSSPPSRAD